MKRALLFGLFATVFFVASSMAPAPVLDTTNYYTMLKLGQDFIDFIDQADSKLSGSISDKKMLEAIALIKDESQKDRTGRTDAEKNRIHNEMQRLEEALGFLNGEDINKILNVLSMKQQDLQEIKGFSRPKNKIRFEIKTRLNKELSAMILKAFKLLSRTFHPDKNPSISKELFQEFSNAKEIANSDFRMTYNTNLSLKKEHVEAVQVARNALKQKESARAQQEKSSEKKKKLDKFDALIMKSVLNQDEYEQLIKLFCDLIKILAAKIEDSDQTSKSIKSALDQFFNKKLEMKVVLQKVFVNLESNKKFIEKLDAIVFGHTQLKLADWLKKAVKNESYRGRVLGFFQIYLVNKIEEMMATPGIINSEPAQVAWEILNNATNPVVMKIAPDCLVPVLNYLEKIKPKDQFKYDSDAEINLVEGLFQEFFKVNQKDSIDQFIQKINNINQDIKIIINKLHLFLSKTFENRIEAFSLDKNLSDQEIEQAITLILKFARKNFFLPSNKRSISKFLESFLKIRFLSNKKEPLYSQEILLSPDSAASKLYLDIDTIDLKNLEKFITILAKKLGSKNENEFAQALDEGYTCDEIGNYEKALRELYKINDDGLHIAWIGTVLETYKKKVIDKADLSTSYKFKLTKKSYTILEILENLNKYRTMHIYRSGTVAQECLNLLKNLAEFIAAQEQHENFGDIKNFMVFIAQVVPNNFFEKKPKPEVKPIKKDELKLSKKMKKLADSLTQLKEKLRHLLGDLKTLKKNIKKPAH